MCQPVGVRHGWRGFPSPLSCHVEPARCRFHASALGSGHPSNGRAEFSERCPTGAKRNSRESDASERKLSRANGSLLNRSGRSWGWFPIFSSLPDCVEIFGLSPLPCGPSIRELCIICIRLRLSIPAY